MGKSTSINPTTGQTIKTYNHLTDTQLTARIETANEAYQSWKSTSFVYRISANGRYIGHYALEFSFLSSD